MKLCILGSTGSIGVQALDVARNVGIQIVGLAAMSNIDLLERQIKEFNPLCVCVADKTKARELARRNVACEVIAGGEGLCQLAAMGGCDTVLSAVVGIAGLKPAVSAIQARKKLALANKETLVAGGEFVMELAKRLNVPIIPVDSEHSAIFQCLDNKNHPKRIYLTASGGAFREWSAEQLLHATAADALKHPTWNMGAKITIDCATMMNKGLEFIEAMRLFDLKPEEIEILIHPQSVVHSMVEYSDGSILAQLGAPDMRIPIQYALTYPARVASAFKKLDFTTCGPLTFHKPDFDKYTCLRLAIDAAKMGGLMPAALNAANEVAVGAFLQNRISYTRIAHIIDKTLSAYNLNGSERNLDDILAADAWARRYAETIAIA
ncbi:MAG: 1-deoxy-D-xylulose-5-phosphate reductoisomerase [Clostridiales bacterium]|jgi:1-deoxy-D-xylulose-5-phosphate reductoisomerase|nr:1-deoxy-D-xylulose-5-phosphate reductoisomerase [Clostridiales bacterium]